MLIWAASAKAVESKGCLGAQRPSALLLARLKVEKTMRELNGLDLVSVSGGAQNWKLDLIDSGQGCARESYRPSYDADAGTSWSIYSTASKPTANQPPVTSVCTTTTVGPATVQICANSDNTTSTQTCVNMGLGGSINGVVLGQNVSVCTTVTTTR